MARPARWSGVALVGLLLLATGLRFYHLDAQSFWNDEGNTARLVERPILKIIAGAKMDIHPPGYYLLLHLWRGLAGETEFALRAYSALCGVLMVAIAAALGRHAGGRLAGMGAAAFVAVHPLAVYYSQEARMYAQLGLVAALALWAGTRLVAFADSGDEGKRDMRVYVPHVLLLSASITLGLYTQYAYLFALFGLDLALGLYWLIRRPWNWPLLLAWGASHVLAALTFLPWAPVMLRASGWRPPDLDTVAALPSMARTLLAGITLPGDEGQALVVLLVVWVLAALPARPRQAFVKWAALGMALVPPLMIAGLGMYRPAYLKFLLATLAPLAVALALPLAWPPSNKNLSRSTWRSLLAWGCFAVASVALIAALPAQISALRHLYGDPAYARDDYRGIAGYIAAEGRPGDAILLSAPNQWEVFTYYYRGPLPVYPTPYQPTLSEAQAWVAEHVTPPGRLLVLYWGDQESDPEHLIEGELALQAYKAGEQWMGNVRFARYGTTGRDEANEVHVDARLGEAIVLERFGLPERAFAPGEIVPLALIWSAEAPVAQRYKVFVHVLDAGGQLVAQNDSEPGSGFMLTDAWGPGDTLSPDLHGVYLPPDLAPGDYTLWVGMYDFAGMRLPIRQSDTDVRVSDIVDTLWLAGITVTESR